MAKNARLSPAESNVEEEEHLLDDGIFPDLYGGLDEAPPESTEGMTLDGELVLLEEEPSALGRRVHGCEQHLVWYHASGTPLGYHLLQALGAQAKLLQSCCLRIATHYDQFEFELPLYPWFRANSSSWAQQVKSGDDLAEPLQVLVKSLRTWSSLDQAIGVLGGSATLTLRSVRNPMVLLDRWIGGEDSLPVALPQGASPEDQACPSVAGLAVGQSAITKGAAKASAYLYVARLEEAAKEMGVDFDGTPYYRGSVFDLRTLKLFDPDLVGKRPGKLSSLLTFLAASDLALFTPLHPVFSTLREGLRWDDLHPGFRLQRAFQIIEDKGLELESTEPQAYWDFVSAICEQARWPEVPRFLDAARASGKEVTNDLLGDIFRDACEVRERQPCAFFDPFDGAKHLAKLGPPATQLASFETSGDTDRALAFAMDAELYAMGFQLLFTGGEPSFQCPQYREIVGQLETPEDLVKTYYGIEL